jgi:hypothetical protein
MHGIEADKLIACQNFIAGHVQGQNTANLSTEWLVLTGHSGLPGL